MSEEPGEAKVFFVETRFQKIARQPGDLSREEAIAHAKAYIDTLKPEFSEWLEHKLQELTTAIEYAAAANDMLSQLELAYGHCCQLRDVGATMNFELTTIISNGLCEILDAVIKKTAAYHKETIDCHLEALLLTSKPPYCNSRPDQLPEMTNGLRRIAELALARVSSD